jgi:RNA recognition motif-containing protein
MGVKLFVGSLSFSTSNDRLREAFSRFGVVESAMVMMDRTTGRSRGFGFVEMATAEAAQLAIDGMNGSSLDGRAIHVDRATPRGAPGTGPRPGGPRPGGGERRFTPGGAPGGPRPGSRFPDAPPPTEERGGGRAPRGRGGERPRRPGDDRPRRAPGGRRPGERRSEDRGRGRWGDEGGYRSR